ncbi:hypothetical protein BsWGS_26213 [Bradybaena similaris]
MSDVENEILKKITTMRTYKRHTDRGMFKRDTMMSAVTAVVDNGESIRQAAKNYGVNYKTLGRYVKTKTQTGTLANASFGYSTPRKVFEEHMEQILVDYAILASQIYHGLTIYLVFKQSGSGKHINLRKLSFTTEAENESHTDNDQSDSSLDESVDDILENEEPFIETPNITQLSAENFVLVRFATKKTFRYFIGKIESLDPSDNTIEVQFMKRKPTKTDTLIFVFPDHEDAGEVHMSDVIILLPKPATGGTVRSGTIYTFSCEKLKSYVIE